MLMGDLRFRARTEAIPGLENVFARTLEQSGARSGSMIICTGRVPCQLQDPPKVKWKRVAPADKRSKRTLNFEAFLEQNEKGEATKDLGVFKMGIEEKTTASTTIALTREKTCCFECFDVFVYEGDVAKGARINDFGQIKAGPLVIMSGLKKLTDKCKNCRPLGVNVVLSSKATFTPAGGEEKSEEEKTNQIDTLPESLKLGFIGMDQLKLADNGADFGFADFPSPRLDEADLKSGIWKDKASFKTWYFCDRTSENMPPTFQGWITWEYEQEISVVVDKDPSKTTITSKLSFNKAGIKCSEEGAAIDKAFQDAVDSFVTKVKATAEFKSLGEDAQNKRLAGFVQVKNANPEPREKK
jgi:hypothetical protein